MCGIIVTNNHVLESELTHWVYRLKHRGPDGISYYQNESVRMAFSRLAINDPSELGMQPIETDECISMINGEIYNHKEIRDRYKLKYSGDADTNVVGPFYEVLKENIINHMDGFYSGVIFDKQAQRLLTLRDYLGKKGLFIVKSGKKVIITSELKSIPYFDSFQVIPLGVCEIDMVTGNVKRISSHQLPLIGPGESLRELLIASVKKRIPANNTPFGVFLSGGLDSSILAQILISLNANAIFYLLGEDGKSDDLLAAKLLVKHLDIINYRITPLPSREQFPCLIEEVVRSTESFNPSIISNGICTHLLSKAAKEDNLKIIVSGEGADELFGGYNYQNIDDDWRLFKDNLLSDMNFTELRRVDLSCMNNSIEARFPYLDKDVYSFAHGLEHKDLYSIYGTVPMNKYILRKAFENYLPKEIVWRKKTSSDVGSGIRKIVVNYLTRDNESEKIVLKRIWEKIYPHYPLDHYFHSYPCFDSVIENRSVVHKS